MTHPGEPSDAPDASMPLVRLAHFSDVHVCLDKYRFGMRDLFSKRTAGWVNLRLLGRAHRFRHADQALRALARDLELRQPDHRVFSGDASCLGFDEEFAEAAEILGIQRFPGIAVPGNHDHLLRRTVSAGMFERRFSPWQEGVRLDKAIYPFAQRVGPLWLVAVNSSKPNALPWDATGAVGQNQLDRLARLLDQLDGGLRVLVTHYPVRLDNGKPEWRTRRLRDLEKLVRVAEEGGVALWMHGHRHHAYHHKAGNGLPFAVICSGSATQTGRWSYGEYTIQGNILVARRRLYSPADNLFIPGDSFTLELPRGLESPLAVT
jgi:3',5'-cyclic AMP phosphodiesterase CpdA